MSISIGLVGLPNAGKSTLFNALTGQSALVASYPFATIEPNLGEIVIPDSRLQTLSQIFGSQKRLAASIKCLDVAGLIEGASQGQGLGNRFLSHVRSANLVALVSQAFSDDLKQVSKGMQTIMTELLLSDWQTLDNQRQKLAKPAMQDPKLKRTLSVIEQALSDIDSETWLSLSGNASDYRQSLAYLNLLTLKPLLHVFNLNSSDLNKQKLQDDLKALCKGRPFIFLSAELETELCLLAEDERLEFIEAYGQKQLAKSRIAESCLKLLNMQTFLTAGKQESRSWLIPKDCPAPEAAGVIHSDLQRGFIAAEIVGFSDLKRLKSWSAAKAEGCCRIEGKDYKMQVGDVVDFKFNV